MLLCAGRRETPVQADPVSGAAAGHGRTAAHCGRACCRQRHIKRRYEKALVSLLCERANSANNKKSRSLVMQRACCCQRHIKRGYVKVLGFLLCEIANSATDKKQELSFGKDLTVIQVTGTFVLCFYYVLIFSSL